MIIETVVRKNGLRLLIAIDPYIRVTRQQMRRVEDGVAALHVVMYSAGDVIDCNDATTIVHWTFDVATVADGRKLIARILTQPLGTPVDDRAPIHLLDELRHAAKS